MRRERLAAVIFDLDGLVLDTETTYCSAKQRAAEALGWRLPEAFWQALPGLHQSDIEQLLCGYQRDDFERDQFNQLSAAYWRDDVTVNGIQIKPGFSALIDFIVEQAIPYCLATNSNADNAAECLRLAGLQAVFPVIISRDDVRHGKPAPDIFLHAAEALNVNINQCWVLEDSLTGITAAVRAGAYAVLVPSLTSFDRASAIAHLTLPDLTGVLAALRAKLAC
jgi:beta-phosphoglucomutase-like phosphatase (HAD superfamily)